MSKIALEPNASGTGTFTIASPNSNTSRTLTLPDAAGELLTDGSSLDAGNLTGTLPAIDGSALTGVGEKGVGVSQTWQGVTASRSIGTVYQNTSDRPIVVSFVHTSATIYTSLWLSEDNTTYLNIAVARVPSSERTTINAIIPVGYYYKLTSGGYNEWRELR